MEIYVLIDNQPQGPYTQEQIREFLKTGELQATQLAAYAGSTDWLPLSTMMRSWGAPSVTRGRQAGAHAPSGNNTGKKRLIGIVVAVLALSIAAGGFIWWKRTGNARSTVTVSRPLEPGLPNTLTELNDWYQEPPAGQNAAVIFLKGFDALQVTDADRNSSDLPAVGTAPLPTLGSPLPPKLKAAAAAFLSRNQAALAHFQQGSKIESSRYPADLRHASDVSLPHIRKIKDAVQVERLAAIFAADSKQTKESVDAILVQFALARSLEPEPIVVSQMARATSEAITVRSLEYLVNLNAVAPRELEQLNGVFSRLESDASAGTHFTRSLVGERLFVLSALSLPPDKIERLLTIMYPKDDALWKELEREGARKKLFLNREAQPAFCDESFRQLIALRKEPPINHAKILEFSAQRAAQVQTNRFALLSLVQPVFEKIIRKEQEELAQLRLGMVGVALERYRAAGNGYPTALSELSPRFMPSVPNDPFNGEALHYRRTATGYHMYSIGSDVNDDKGKRVTQTGGDGDLVFEVIKAPPPAR